MEEKVNISVKVEPLDNSYEEIPVTVKEEPSEPTSLQLEPFCTLCLRERLPNAIFYEFGNENSGPLQDTIRQTFGFELPAKHFFICTPCRKMLKLIESFKACCLKAFSWAERHARLERVELPMPMAIGEDWWFTDESMKAIGQINGSVDKRIKQIELAGTEVKMEVEEPCVDGAARKQVKECRKCHRKFFGMRSLTAHKANCKGASEAVQDEQLHVCPICSVSFRRPLDLEAHVNMHEGNKVYECRITCGERFYGKNQLWRHEKLCRKNVGLERKDPVEGSEPESDNDSIEINECRKCHRRFDGRQSLVSHLVYCQKEDQARKVFTCNICSISCVSTQMLNAHLNKHKGVKPYVCRKFCDRTFYGAVYRYRHERVCREVEVEVQAVECENCHRFLEGKQGLYLHSKTCRKDQEERRLLYQCDACPISFTSKAHLKAHRNKHLGIKPFECAFNCGKSFFGALQLKKHVQTCPRRPASVPTVSSKDKKEPKPKPEPEEDAVTLEVIPCENCDRLFDSKGGLISHLRRCQPGNTKGEDDQLMYKCQICSVSFTRKPLLQAHVDKHNGIKPFSCGRCGLKFFNLKPKNQHEKNCQIHRCESCKQEFATSGDLVQHVKDAHGDGKLTCESCGKQFYRKFNLLQHQKQKHPVALTQVSVEMSS